MNRFVVISGLPLMFSQTMVSVIVLPSGATVRLALLWRFRSHDLNMASTFECSRNDVISNVGVLLAAAAVAALSSPWPDILIGSLLAIIIFRSSVRVLTEAIPQLRAERA